MSIGPYYVGDTPATPIEIDLVSDEDLDGYTLAHVEVRDPDGNPVGGEANLPIADESIVVTLPAVAFTLPGIHVLTIKLTGPAHAVTLAPQRFVVQGVDGWHNLDSARAVWSGAPNDDAALYEVLEIARDQVLAYAIAKVPERIPTNYKRAQYMQARNLWNAAAKDSGDSYGGEGFAVTVFPLEWNVKNLIRPKRGVPIVG